MNFASFRLHDSLVITVEKKPSRPLTLSSLSYLHLRSCRFPSLDQSTAGFVPHLKLIRAESRWKHRLTIEQLRSLYTHRLDGLGIQIHSDRNVSR